MLCRISMNSAGEQQPLPKSISLHQFLDANGRRSPNVVVSCFSDWLTPVVHEDCAIGSDGRSQETSPSVESNDVSPAQNGVMVKMRQKKTGRRWTEIDCCLCEIEAFYENAKIIIMIMIIMLNVVAVDVVSDQLVV
ncbi:hypothetical protein Tsp_03729 [Trichinella spiralis]|uniref:hypothetical protein n=1 Tax=Trichinella spiralis TaxID=6334 RepID=UPI0001EFBB10|nr:hypothetical protein Tsp_03729 [Trichinella spiralis]